MRAKKYSEEAIRAALAEFFVDFKVKVKEINGVGNNMHVKFDTPVLMHYTCENTEKAIEFIVDGIKSKEGSK